MKKDIIDVLKAKGYSAADADRTLTLVTDSIAEVARTKGEAAVPGFGKFKRTFRPARDSRNPRTGETLRTQDKHVITFKASSTLVA